MKILADGRHSLERLQTEYCPLLGFNDGVT